MLKLLRQTWAVVDICIFLWASDLSIQKVEQCTTRKTELTEPSLPSLNTTDSEVTRFSSKLLRSLCFKVEKTERKGKWQDTLSVNMLWRLLKGIRQTEFSILFKRHVVMHIYSDISHNVHSEDHSTHFELVLLSRIPLTESTFRVCIRS
jgi:hypothetical protein